MRFGSLIGLIALAIALYILWCIRQVLLLAFMAIVLATTLNRLVKLLQRLKIKRGVAVALSTASVLILLTGFFALVVPPFVEQTQKLIELVPAGLEELRGWSTKLQNLLPEQLVNDFQSFDAIAPNLQDWVTKLFDNFFTFFSSSLSIILNGLLVVVVTIMFLASPHPYRRIFISAFPAFYRRRIDEVLDECEDALGGWAVGILFNMSVIAIFSGIGLWILGVQLPLANALIAGLLTFIPNIGPVLSVIPPTALALMNAPWQAVAVIILYVLIQQLESNVLTPLVMKKQVSLLPAVTLLSQVAFAVFFGILGLFLALPIAIVLQIFLREILVKDILDRWQEPSRNHRQKYLVNVDRHGV